MPLFVCALLVCATGGTVICLQAQMGLAGGAICFGRALDLVGRWVGVPRIPSTCPGFADALVELCKQFIP